MAHFSISAGADWIAPMTFGAPSDFWRLSDYTIWLQIKSPNDATVLRELSNDDGSIIVTDDAARRLEINVGWTVFEEIGAGPFEFDLVFEHETTEVRSRSGPHTLAVDRGITFPEAVFEPASSSPFGFLLLIIEGD